MRRDNSPELGLFGFIDGGAQIRNLGLLNALVDYTGAASTSIGGLAGYQLNGSIIASWADTTTDGGSNGTLPR